MLRHPRSFDFSLLALLTIAIRCQAPSAPARTPARCTVPAVSGFSLWDVETSKDGSTLRTDGASSLVTRDGEYVAKVAFSLAGPSSYGTVNVPLRSQREDTTHRPADLSVDLDGARSVTVTYASTADVFLQVRHGARAHGGHHYRAKLRKTGGALRTEVLPFSDFSQPSWVTAADRYPLDLADVFSFTFAALESTELVVGALEIDGIAPACD